MSLVRWDPFDELSSLRERVNRLFSETMGGSESLPIRRWSPACDIQETESEVIITADLPGVSKEEVNVELVGDTLTLSGERKQESEEKKNGYHRIERAYGKFQRSFTLATEVNHEAIAASFDKGVLTIRLPKSEKVKPKQIPINVS